MNVDGSNEQQLTFNTASDDGPRWSPDARKIAFHSDRTGTYNIWVMDADGANPQQLTHDTTAAYCATWSPDGQEIAYASYRSGNYEIWIMNADGTHERQLTQDHETDVWPHWSPDGTKIVYESRGSSNWEIKAINVDGSGLTNLTNNPAQEEQPNWSPDGTQIAFMRDFQIWVMNADGSNAHLLASDLPDGAHHPVWSPDGTRLLHFVWTSLHLVNADGSGHRVLASGGPNWYMYPDWSPAQAQIVFQSLRDGDREIFVMNSDGSDERQLTFNTASDDAPHWSPDARKIAFHSDRTGTFNIWVMDADGANPQQLTHDPTAAYYPTWSPDSKKIAYISYRSGNGEIWIMDADGTNERQLTQDHGIAYWPHWSPDGNKIVYGNRGASNWEIYVINVDGTGLTNLTNSPGYLEEQPHWSPDGTQIAYMRDFQIWVMNADGSNAHLLASDLPDGAHHPVWSPDGTRLLHFVWTSLHLVNADGSGHRVLVSGGPNWYMYPDWTPAYHPGNHVNTPPEADAGPDQVVEQTAPSGTRVTLDGSASSDLDGDPLTYTWTEGDDVIAGPSTQPAAEVDLQLGRHEIVLTVDDGRGGTDTDDVVITVVDTQPPVIDTLRRDPPELTLPAEQETRDGTWITLFGHAEDSCALSDLFYSWYIGGVKVGSGQTLTYLFPLGKTKVTFEATDHAGKTVSQDIEVEVVDTTPPELTVPALIIVEQATRDGTVVEWICTATDICDAEVEMVCTPPSGSVFPLGTTTVTCTATDDAGKQTSKTFTVTVVDTTKPTITPPADVTTEQTSRDGTKVNLGTPTVSDLCDASPVVANNAPAVFPLGTTVVTWTATDAHGNQATAQQKVTVVDTKPPVVNAGPDLEFIQGETVQLPPPTVSDICDANPFITDNRPAQFPVGQTTVTFTAEDASGNVGSDEIVVTVIKGQDAIDDLKDVVDELPLSNGEKNSLNAKLDAAIKSLDKGQKTAAVNQLQAFINQVQALQRSGRLNVPTAADLIARAQRIIAAIQAQG